MTFTQATVYAPLILILLLYLPTIIYIVVISIRFYGLTKWLTETLNDPVYFIFPILTNMSFYEKCPPHHEVSNPNGHFNSTNAENECNSKEVVKSAAEECQSKSNLHVGEIEEEKNDQIQIEMNYEGGGQSTEEIEVEQYVDIKSVDNFFESEEKHFSVKQSNMLFLLFLLSSLFCILADLSS